VWTSAREIGHGLSIVYAISLDKYCLVEIAEQCPRKRMGIHAIVYEWNAIVLWPLVLETEINIFVEAH
jgi:hypothetical protein